ncbi:hypothetical protein LINGRAHAP2_LOCUS24397 [Linum grandiflorum]
MILMLW